MNSTVADRLLPWFSLARRELPWRKEPRDPYRVWVSEVMLQQTRVEVVVPYYRRFLRRFPSVRALARAPLDDVLALWSGLGYYARARNLHRAAREVVQRRGGTMPSSSAELARLPGIGRSTAAAIAAFASGECAAILDGNVKRVLARHAGVAGDPSAATVQARLWKIAEERLPRRGIEAYTQGLMDLGASLCARSDPRCERCPVAVDCVARIEGRIDELPGKRPRRPARRKRVAMLVVVSKGEVLLEKRPASGIWGGLWSLPELTAKPAARAIAREWGITASRLESLPRFEHAFTHFTLEVEPWRVHVKKAALPRGKAATWMPLAEIAGAALPAPVKKLLAALA
jgi:A/G-specific adenine glycosylase